MSTELERAIEEQQKEIDGLPSGENVSRVCTCHPDDNQTTPCEHRYAFLDCARSENERYLLEMLATLKESYAKAAKPYIDRLVAIRMIEAHPRPIVMTAEQAPQDAARRISRGPPA